jgi:hypothetical protein
MGSFNGLDKLFNDDSMYQGYSYLTISQDIPLNSTLLFFEGVVSLAKRDMFLASKRTKKFDELSKEELIKIAKFEADSARTDKLQEPYDFCNVIAGITEIGVLNYFNNMELYKYLFSKLQDIIHKPLEKKYLLEILKAHPHSPVIREFPKIPREVEWQQTYNPNMDVLTEYSQLLFPKSIIEGLDWGYFLQSTSEIMQIYEELRVLQERIHQDINAIKWEIRCMDELYHENPDEQVIYSARNLLRALPILDVEGRSANNPRREFDKYRLWSVKDSFRTAIAESLGALDEDLTLIIFNEGLPKGDLEITHFQEQYNAMTPQGRNSFDRLAYGILEKVAKQNDMIYELSVVQYP